MTRHTFVHHQDLRPFQQCSSETEQLALPVAEVRTLRSDKGIEIGEWVKLGGIVKMTDQVHSAKSVQDLSIAY